MFAEFTALVASQSPLVIEGLSPVPDGPLWVYWQYSQAALRHWRKTLLDDDAAADVWRLTQQLDAAQQTLVTEMLTRVWGAVLTASDLHRAQRRAEPIACGVFKTHLDCRRLALQRMAESPAGLDDRMADLDRLRRRVERWTDLLLGPLVARFGDRVAQFAYEPRRALEFGQEGTIQMFGGISPPAWAFLMAGLQTSFSGRRPSSTNWPEHLLPILRSILAMFPDDAFAGEGLIKSLRIARIDRSSRIAERADTLPSHPHRLLRRDPST